MSFKFGENVNCLLLIIDLGQFLSNCLLKVVSSGTIPIGKQKSQECLIT